MHQCADRPVADDAPAEQSMEVVDDIGVIGLSANVFVELQPRERMLAYWLSQAAVAGDAITYDQRSRFGRAVKTIADGIMSKIEAVPQPLRAKVELFAKKVWINKGLYESRTHRKMSMPLRPDDLSAAMRAALAAGATFDNVKSEADLDTLLKALQPVLFDPSFEPSTVTKSPPVGQDIITASSNTFYQGLTLQQLAGFHEQHPLNSRIVRRGTSLVEEVYRTTPPGLYAAELGKVVEALKEALPLASASQRGAWEHLVRYFEAGQREDFAAFNRAWVKDDSPVDAVLGFIETYGDPRGIHGEYEGAVFAVDPQRTALMKKLAAEAPGFERRMPWADAYKRTTFSPPVANAVVPLTLAGAAGPVAAAGINLPNDQGIRQKDGSKSFFVTTVTDAVSDVQARALASGFIADPAMIPEVRRCGPSVRAAGVMLHEILGHGSGKVSETLKDDPRVALRETGAALEEARAELVAQVAAWDPKTVELGLLPDAACAHVMAGTYPAMFQLRLRMISEGDIIEDDHLRAQSLIVRYAMDNGAVKEIARDGEVYLVVSDDDGWRKAVGELLVEVMRIKAEGDYAKGKALLDRYATKLVPAWRDSAVRRARALGLPSRFAFVSPRIKALRDPQGKVTDATVIDSLSLTETALVDAGKTALP